MLISVFLTGLMSARTEKNDLFASYCVLQACLMLWLLGKLVKTVAPDIDLRWAGVAAQYLGTCFLGPALFAFAYRYCRGVLPPRWFLYACGGVSAAFSVLCATDPLHHLLFSVFTMIRSIFGVFNSVLTAYSLLALGASCALMVWTLPRADARGKRVRLLFLAAIAAPYAGSFYFPNAVNNWDGWNFDVTPVFFGVTFLLFGLAVFRFGMLDLVRCAFNEVMEGMNDGIVLTGADGRIRYANAKMADRLPGPASILSAIGPDEAPVSGVDGFTHAYARSVRDGRGRPQGTVYRFVDRARILALGERYERLCGEMESMNRDLELDIRDRRAEILERHANRLASDLHDVVGHSLVLAIAILDRAAGRSTASFAGDGFPSAAAIIRDGVMELDDVLAGAGDGGDDRMRLSDALAELPELKQGIAVQVDLKVHGAEAPVAARTAVQVQRVCKECLANSIRHGRASRVRLALAFREGRVELDIRDNGRGCDGIRRGNGLRDIAERVRALDGSVRFSSGRGRGFHTLLRFPAA